MICAIVSEPITEGSSMTCCVRSAWPLNHWETLTRTCRS